MAEGTPRTYQHRVAECVVNAVRVNGECARGQTAPRDLTRLSLLAVHGLVDLKRYFNFGMETLPNGQCVTTSVMTTAQCLDSVSLSREAQWGRLPKAE